MSLMLPYPCRLVSGAAAWLMVSLSAYGPDRFISSDHQWFQSPNSLPSPASGTALLARFDHCLALLISMAAGEQRMHARVRTLVRRSLYQHRCIGVCRACSSGSREAFSVSGGSTRSSSD
jgi:hypothetical protein